MTLPTSDEVGTTAAVVLVEGDSDRAALTALAAAGGRDLEREGVEVVSMGGVTNLRTFAAHYGPLGLGLPLTGLYDAPAEGLVRHMLAAAGCPTPPGSDGLARLGFFACTADLEDELIRALGADGVEAVVTAAGEARSLRLLAGMPAQRGWSREDVLRRFLGSRAGRKARYAALLVEALAPDRVPTPLAAVLERARPRGWLGSGHEVAPPPAP